MSTDILCVSGSEALALTFAELEPTMTSEEWETFKSFLLRSNEVWLCYHDQTILCCILGLIPPTIIAGEAYLWLHSTEAIRQYIMAYVMHSKGVVETMLTRYPKLVGHCETESFTSRRWLKWLGAEFGAPEGKLIPFEIKAAV